MTNTTLTADRLLTFEYPISATETKPLADFSEDDVYAARLLLARTQPALAAALTELETEIGLSGGSATDVRPGRLVDILGHAPAPLPLAEVAA